MRLKTLFAVAVAGAFALPLAAQASADGDRMILAQAGGPAGASQQGTGPTGGTPSPRTAGEPKAPAGEARATNEHCKDLKGMEHDNCMRDNRAASGAVTSGSAATGGATTAPSGSVVTPGGSSGSSTTGTTAGPDSASNRTAPSSDTATSPSTSGQGKPR